MKFVFITLVTIVALAAIAQTIVSKSTAKTKTIEYKTLAQKNGFEIREYPELLVASTVLNGSTYSDNSSSGFRKIASYIFGGNSANQQIAMTSPVQMEMSSEPTMSFFMPSDVESMDLPIPNRDDVSVHVQASKIVAVVEFSGWASDEVLSQQFSALKSRLIEESIEFEDTYSYLGYNPPYQLINRKNEIIIPLKSYRN
ncbi:MAG: hypothetical protein ACI84C_001988 [Flavobacteriales bacterium]|jgi:hypothetical protein